MKGISPLIAAILLISALTAVFAITFGWLYTVMPNENGINMACQYQPIYLSCNKNVDGDFLSVKCKVLDVGEFVTFGAMLIESQEEGYHNVLLEAGSDNHILANGDMLNITHTFTDMNFVPDGRVKLQFNDWLHGCYFIYRVRI